VDKEPRDRSERTGTERESSGLRVSVVVACNGAAGALARCLEALEGQLGDAELVVCSPREQPEELRRRYPAAIWLVRQGALVPVLWRDGIRRATGDIVALTISPMVPRHDWLASLRAGLATADAVGGAIEPGPGLRAADLAECFCRYGRDMLPFQPVQSLDLAGDNAAYRRERLTAVAKSWRDGFWEPEVHAALQSHGDRLWRDPAVVVEMGRSAGARAFVRQRVLHGREFGRARGRRSGAASNLARVVLAVAVPVVLAARTFREASQRGRTGQLARVLPLVLLFDAAWATGEAFGHLDAMRGR
jgi:hypothetical protein